jgi:cell division protein ZapA (FtsZ GTPase activity inhibitor)
MAEEKKNTLTVDGKEYDTATLSDNAKNIIANVQFADQELTRLRMQNAAIQTARQAYVTALKKELEGDSADEATDVTA